MVTLFYSTDAGNNGGTGHDNAESKTRFPEDSGMEDGRIPDGGGPADGFISEDGHDAGNGFLGHVDEQADSQEKHSGGNGGSESHK